MHLSQSHEPMLPRCWALLGLVLMAASLPEVHGGEPGKPVDFNREIRPILAKKCYACHGPDEAKRARGLRLDQREAAVKPLKSGETAIVPGDPDASALITRITEEDETLRMPPRKLGPRLAAAEIDLLTRWVKSGAEYTPHWAYLPPRVARVPVVAHPAWARTPIDRFIAARIEQAGLELSPEADRDILARRLSLDLRGLPPTLDELDRIVHDSAPDWYERAVDRFLADPSFGERWARMWLDLARYADSAGYGSDPLRLNIWPYRDWVVNAFNRNLPYDRFTLLQLAGDLLEHPTLEDRFATAFHRNTMTNTEGGTDDEEWRVAAVKDRVDTTMQVWMGLTAGCAKCHSHKFDPITQEEYYQLFAFFNQSADADRGDESPTIAAPSPAIQIHNAEIDRALGPLEDRLASSPVDPAKLEAWADQLKPRNSPNRKGVAGDVLAAIDTPVKSRKPDQMKTLERHYRSIAPELKALRDQISALKKRKVAVPSLPVMVELEKGKNRVTHLLRKGNYLDPAQAVHAQTPRALPPFPEGAPGNRLGLAQWLIDARNPLTARVAVNRYWARIFGTGLVETEEDFGVQGEPPSHPELLDWLAIWYRDSGWDNKALLRLIVTSAVYRQSSRTTPLAHNRDPRNRLVSHFPRVRLEAEMVRDQALAASGLLTRKLGGPSVYPPQPAGLWQAAFNGERNWAESQGPERYRRGVYVFWRRTIPYPSMAAFDAPSRELCTIKRTNTNTPLQAFVTLNDPVYVEAARALAQRLIREAHTPRDRAARGLTICLCRQPRAEQVDRLLDLYSAELDRFSKDAQAAAALAGSNAAFAAASPAEQAAWTAVAGVLLNLDGVLTKG